MHNNNYDTLTTALNDLKKRGYTEDFNLTPECLVCPSKQLQLHPEHFEIDEVHRFEGMSNPDDNSVVYAISARGYHDLKGVLVDAYGVYAESLTPDMASKLRAVHDA